MAAAGDEGHPPVVEVIDEFNDPNVLKKCPEVLLGLGVERGRFRSAQEVGEGDWVEVDGVDRLSKA